MTKYLLILFCICLIQIGCKESKLRHQNPDMAISNVSKTDTLTNPNNIVKTNETAKSKWDQTLERIPKGDTIGWYRNSKGYWIDTMRDYRNIYSLSPSFDDNKVYYSNATVHIFKEAYNDTVFHTKEKLKVYVKTLDQKPVKWLYPLKDSKLLKEITSLNFRIEEKSYSGLSGVLIENDKYDWITIHVRQYGEIILSDISTWKFGKEGMENVLTEIQIYDLKGNLFYSVIEDGVMPTSTVTLNKKYLLTCSGGQFTENEKDFLPFTANIYDIEKGETVWKDKSTEYQINIEADRHSNWVRLTYVKNYDWKDPSNLFYLLDLENYIFWKFKSLDKCVSGEVRMYLEPKQFIFYNTKLGDNIIENELKLEIDFKRIEELPHDK